MTMRNILIVIAVITLWSCGSDGELRKSVFIRDPDFPELPQYSEWGYNTFGAYYGRQPFVSNDEEVPLNVIVHDDVTSFDFKGQLGGYSYYSYSDKQFLLRLTFSDFHPEIYEDLISLDKTTFDLTDPQFSVSVTDFSGIESPVEILEGQFMVKRAQMLLVDKEKQQVILSGVFSFKAIIGGEAVSVSDGRFDVGVSAISFFKY